jgi:hypothetical protein
VKDLGVHLALFVAIATAIVTLGVFYSDAEDRAAFRHWPRRMLHFCFGCVILVAILLVCEHTFASLE